MPDRKPVTHHFFLTDASGGLLPIYQLTGEKCPLCPPIRKEAVLGVTYSSADGRSETVGCCFCDYQTTRSVRDPLGRRMNQGEP